VVKRPGIAGRTFRDPANGRTIEEAIMTDRATARHDSDDVAEHAVAAEPYQWRGVGPVAFTPLEEQVIELALRDGLGSIEEPGTIERLFAVLFGLRAGRRTLADPRLEALRRAVVVTRHRHHLPDAQALSLREAGFAPTQIRMIEARAVAG
jgi:alkylhydroperoxidase family enzyme